MIAKHINFKNRTHSDIVRLVKYITSEQDKSHCVGDVMISNCDFDDPEIAALKMLVTQAYNKRAKDTGKAAPIKTYRKEPLGLANPLKAEFEQLRKNRDAARKIRFAEIRGDYRRKAAEVRTANYDARQREAVSREQPRHTWLSWLQAEAKAGKEEALKILRGRALACPGRPERPSGEKNPARANSSPTPSSPHSWTR